MKLIPTSWRVMVGALALCSCLQSCAEGQKLRVTTWNLEWFPNGSPRELDVGAQNIRIAAAAEVLRRLDPDILLLQEVKDYDACARLASAIRPGAYQIAICSAFKQGHQLGRQQEAILAKVPAQAAWAESWKSAEGIDPPRGFAFAWFKINGVDLGVYCVHLKSNLVRGGDEELSIVKNIRKREVAADQLLAHMRDTVAVAMPNVKEFIVGGDFNTDKNQELFARETSLIKLADGGFRSCFGDLPITERVTHPGKGKYPDATFDYLLGKNVTLEKLVITKSDVSDHLPVTCEVESRSFR